MKKFKLVFVIVLFFNQNNTSAQLLNKLKNKINNAIDKTIDKTMPSNTNTADYCTDKEAIKSYKIIYKGTANTKIFYDESSISASSNGDDYRIIFKEGKDFIVIENGKTIYKGKTLPDSYLKRENRKNKLSKYLVVDSSKISFKEQKAFTVKTADKIDKKKLNQGIEISRNTAEYKAMSAEEKADYEEFAKNSPQIADSYNKSGFANKTFTSPEIKPISVYQKNCTLIVNGKNYLSKTDELFDYYVSDDEENIYVYGKDAAGKSFFQTNEKKIYLDNNAINSSLMTQLLVSKDGKKASIISINKIPESENNSVYIDNVPTIATVIGDDGIAKKVKVNLNNYALSGDGKVVSANKNNGQVLVDGKKIGTFNTNTDSLEISALLLAGTTPNKIGRYNSDGSIDFLDGKTKNIGALFPVIKNQNGKIILNWFLECENTIYLAKMEL